MPAGFSNFERGPKLIRGPVTIDGTLTTGAITGNITGNVTGNLTGNTAGAHTGPVIGGDVLADATLTFDDAGTTTITVPTSQAWFVDAVMAFRETAFDAGIKLDVGPDGDDDGYLDNIALDATGPVGLIAAERGTKLFQTAADGPPIIEASPILDFIAPAGTATIKISGSPTVGEVRVLILGRRVAV